MVADSQQEQDHDIKHDKADVQYGGAGSDGTTTPGGSSSGDDGVCDLGSARCLVPDSTLE